VEKIRPITITVASIAFIIFGLVAIVFAVLLGVLLYSTTVSLSEPGAFVISLFIFFIALLGFLDTLAGYGLWHMKRWGAIMGMLLGMIGLIFQSFSVYALYGAYYNGYPSSIGYVSSAGAGSPWADIILILLIAISWRSFEPSTVA
jgi:hypothetical protein